MVKGRPKVLVDVLHSFSDFLVLVFFPLHHLLFLCFLGTTDHHHQHSSSSQRRAVAESPAHHHHHHHHPPPPPSPLPTNDPVRTWIETGHAAPSATQAFINRLATPKRRRTPGKPGK